jgi:uncharacterized protein involved in exopolysaccharide biosynthesis
MQNLLNSESKDEIDLRELFITLWAYKLLITVICVLSIVCARYYILNADKEFTSSAIFKLDKNDSNNMPLDTDSLALASLTGLTNISESILPLDMVNGRVFIEKLDTLLNFQADTYFNTYDPNLVDPIWKSIVKRAIGWQRYSSDSQEAIWQEIIKTYSKNVVLDETEDGSIIIQVTHVNPQRAAEIANVIMNKIISGTKNKKDTEQDGQLTYLSNTLAKALSDLEISQSKLKKFALQNSALPLESFAAESLQLDGLREQLYRTIELHEAVAALLVTLQNKSTSHNDYLALRQKFPIVDQVEFRRVLGQNEIISSWTWPEASSVNAVYDTLSERKSRLEAKINASQIEAEQIGLKVETYAKLQREAKITEATYTVLIEQVKAQSMAAGYRPDRTEIFEYATASIKPSAPKHELILALGAILGLLLGALLSLILAQRRDVYNSINSLQAAAQAQITASIKPLLPLRNKSLNDLSSILVKKSPSILRDLAVRIHKNAATQVVVSSSNAKMTGNDLARALSSYMQSDTMKIAVIDFSSKSKKLDIEGKRPSIKSFIVAESSGHLSALRPHDGLEAIEMLSQRNFWENTQSLYSTFDLVFLCADDSNAISLLSALEGKETLHIMLVRSKKTKCTTLVQMRSLLPVQGLLHD